MRHERSPAMTRTRRKTRHALDELRCAPRDSAGADRHGLRGCGNQRIDPDTLIQIRYCTATTADKPFGEMQNLIGLRGLGALSQQEKTRQT
jgi:hypothetical protein